MWKYLYNVLRTKKCIRNLSLFTFYITVVYYGLLCNRQQRQIYWKTHSLVEILRDFVIVNMYKLFYTQYITNFPRVGSIKYFLLWYKIHFTPIVFMCLDFFWFKKTMNCSENFLFIFLGSNNHPKWSSLLLPFSSSPFEAHLAFHLLRPLLAM